MTVFLIAWGKTATILLRSLLEKPIHALRFIAIPDAEVPQAVEPTFQHVITTYASEANKTVSVWRAVPDDLLDFKPHEKTNAIRTILVHQLLSERRFFAQFVGNEEPPAPSVAGRVTKQRGTMSQDRPSKSA